MLAFLTKKLELVQAASHDTFNFGIRFDHLIHGDLHHLNIFFDAEESVSHVFDFERVMVGDRIADLLYTIFLSFLDTAVIDDENFQCIKSFLNGYQKNYPLTHAELEDRLHWFYWNEIVMMLWIETNYYLRNETRSNEYLPHRKRRLEYISSNPDAFFARVLSCLPR